MEVVLQIAAAIASIFAAYKVFADIIFNASKKHREEYQFTKDYLIDLCSDDVHSYVKEKGFRALTGLSYSVGEIKYLLSMNKPTKAINLRSSSDGFIEFDTDEGSYRWLRLYKYELCRNSAPVIFIFLYVVFGLLAFLPLVLRSIISLNSFTQFTFGASMAVIAIICLAKHINIVEAKKFMDFIDHA